MLSEISLNAIEALLPESVRELAALIGLPATERLVKRYGGIGVRVPKTMRPDHPLAVVVGFEAAATLAAAYGGTVLEVRACHQVTLAIRNAEIRRRHEENGEPTWRLALEYELSQRQIKSIVGQGDVGPGQQGDLFA